MKVQHEHVSGDAHTEDDNFVNIISYAMTPGDVVHGYFLLTAVNEQTHESKAFHVEFLVHRNNGYVELAGDPASLLPNASDISMQDCQVQLNPSEGSINIAVKGLVNTPIFWNIDAEFTIIR